MSCLSVPFQTAVTTLLISLHLPLSFPHTCFVISTYTCFNRFLLELYLPSKNLYFLLYTFQIHHITDSFNHPNDHQITNYNANGIFSKFFSFQCKDTNSSMKTSLHKDTSRIKSKVSTKSTLFTSNRLMY